LGNEPLSDKELEALREQALRWMESKKSDGFELIERIRVYESLERSAPEPSRILAVEIRGLSEFLEAFKKVHQARREFWRTQPKKVMRHTEQEQEERARKDDEFHDRLKDLEPESDKFLNMLEYFQPENMRLIVDSGIAKVLRAVEAQNHADEDQVNKAERLEWYDRWVVYPCAPGEELIDPDAYKERLLLSSKMECQGQLKGSMEEALAFADKVVGEFQNLNDLAEYIRTNTPWGLNLTLEYVRKKLQGRYRDKPWRPRKSKSG
jgi:hypothetical protein